jgi:hypothetical protein
MTYQAVTQFTILRPDGKERLVVIGEMLPDTDPAVLADQDASGGRQPLQLFRKVA